MLLSKALATPRKKPNNPTGIATPRLKTIDLDQCFSNFCTPERTYETTKTLRRTIVIYIAKLVMNFRNRKIIKNLLEITLLF